PGPADACADAFQRDGLDRGPLPAPPRLPATRCRFGGLVTTSRPGVLDPRAPHCIRRRLVCAGDPGGPSPRRQVRTCGNETVGAGFLQSRESTGGMTPAYDRLPTDYDCCVVGAGPVGLVFALEAAEMGARVLLVDAGDGDTVKQPVSRLPGGHTHIVDAARHTPLDMAIRRGVGGTARLWGGRCVGLEAIDFEPRDYVPDSGWPITVEDVAPWYDAAARHLDCGHAVFRSEVQGWPGFSNFQVSNLERWVRRPRLDRGLAARVLAHRRITTLLDTNLLDLDFLADGSVRALVAEHDHARIRLRANSYILAMGGLETT